NGQPHATMRAPPAPGHVQAKTGTTSLASALSGYVRRRYVFSVLQNGRPVSTFLAAKAQDRVATALASHYLLERRLAEHRRAELLGLGELRPGALPHDHAGGLLRD